MVNNWWSDNRRFILKLQHDNTVSYWAFCCCLLSFGGLLSVLCLCSEVLTIFSDLHHKAKVKRTAPALPKKVSPSTASLLLTNARLYCKAVARLGQSTLLTFPGCSFLFWPAFIGHPYKMCSMTSEASLITVLDESLFGTQGGVLSSTKD